MQMKEERDKAKFKHDRESRMKSQMLFKIIRGNTTTFMKRFKTANESNNGD